MVKFGQETLLRLCRRKVGVILGNHLLPVPATSSPALHLRNLRNLKLSCTIQNVIL
jgi:hypothetical protein